MLHKMLDCIHLTPLKLFYRYRVTWTNSYWYLKLMCFVFWRPNLQIHVNISFFFNSHSRVHGNLLRKKKRKVLFKILLHLLVSVCIQCCRFRNVHYFPSISLFMILFVAAAVRYCSLVALNSLMNLFWQLIN